MNELIEKYLQGKLTGKQKEKFEERLKNDPSFQEEYQFQKELKESILEEDVMNLRDQLEQITSVNSKKQFIKSKQRKVRVISIAASLLLIVSIGGWLLFFQGNTEPQKIYEQFYQPYENVYSIRSLNIKYDNDSLTRNAFLAYENEQWKKAEETFDLLIQKNPDNMSFLFYGGIVKMELGQTTQALQYFNQVIQTRNTLFTEQAYWYAGLASLKSEKLSQAKKYFTQIIEKGMSREQDARAIIKAL